MLAIFGEWITALESPTSDYISSTYIVWTCIVRLTDFLRKKKKTIMLVVENKRYLFGNTVSFVEIKRLALQSSGLISLYRRNKSYRAYKKKSSLRYVRLSQLVRNFNKYILLCSTHARRFNVFANITYTTGP